MIISRSEVLALASSSSLSKRLVRLDTTKDKAPTPADRDDSDDGGRDPGALVVSASRGEESTVQSVGGACARGDMIVVRLWDVLFLVEAFLVGPGGGLVPGSVEAEALRFPLSDRRLRTTSMWYDMSTMCLCVMFRT